MTKEWEATLQIYRDALEQCDSKQGSGQHSNPQRDAGQHVDWCTKAFSIINWCRLVIWN